MPVIVEGKTPLPEVMRLAEGRSVRTQEELLRLLAAERKVEVLEGESVSLGDKTLVHSGGRHGELALVRKQVLNPGDSVDLGGGLSAEVSQDVSGVKRLFLVAGGGGPAEATAGDAFTQRRSYGRFYSQFINTLTDDIPEDERSQRITRLVESVQDPVLKGKCAGLVGDVTEALEHNRGLVETHVGYESPQEYVLGKVAESMSLTGEKVDAVIRDSRDNASYALRGGIPELRVDGSFMCRLKDVGIVHGDAQAIAFMGHQSDEPSFLLTCTEALGGRAIITEEDNRMKANHEMNHLVFHFLDTAGKDARVAESSPEREKAFRHFRSEGVSYIFDSSVGFANTPIEVLTYTRDPEINRDAQFTRDVAGVCMGINKQRGGSNEDFIQDISGSTSFDDMRGRCLDATSFPEVMDRQVLDVFIGKRCRNFRGREEEVKYVAQSAGMTAEAGTLEDYGRTGLLDYGLKRPSELRKYALEYAGIVKDLGCGDVDTDKMLTEAVSERTKVSAESAKYLAGLPDDALLDIPAASASVQETARRLFWYTRVTQPSVRELYQGILDNCPDLAEAFRDVREDIIHAGEARIRKDLKREQAERVIASASEAMRSLNV